VLKQPIGIARKVIRHQRHNGILLTTEPQDQPFRSEPA
jgi:hypothetical protein